MGLAVIILAAGEGTRMKSERPKVLHEICGAPMIHFVIKAARELDPNRIIAVVGHKAEAVKAEIKGIEFVLQEEQLGTGHAIAQAEEALAGFDGTVMVLSGDTPLVRAETLAEFYRNHESKGAAASLLTARVDNPKGYGRIIRAEDGTVNAIVEEKDATSEERAIDEVNSGTYCFNAPKLFAALTKIDPANAQGEYYLTDVIKIFSATGEKIVASLAEDADELMGINNRAQLAVADRVMRRRINEAHMLAGVTIVEPESTFISDEVRIGRDTVVWPMTFIAGATSIGEACTIGPMSRVISSSIANEVVIDSSVVKESTVEDGATLGPYAHVRPGTLVKKGAKVGGFVEIKKSTIGENSKVPHLSYIGDATLGEYVNIGAGTITCNYDGANKYNTVIEDGAFVGSDTMLVAPVRIGKDAFTGAGSVISKDVPDESLALERTQQVTIENWAKKRRKRKNISTD